MWALVVALSPSEFSSSLSFCKLAMSNAPKRDQNKHSAEDTIVEQGMVAVCLKSSSAFDERMH